MKYIYTKDLLKEINDTGIDIKDHTLRRYVRELESVGYSDISKDEQGARIFDIYDKAVILALVNKIQLEKTAVKTAVNEVIDELDDIRNTVDKPVNVPDNIENSSEIANLLRIVIEQNERLYNRIEELEKKIADQQALNSAEEVKEIAADIGEHEDVQTADNDGHTDVYTDVQEDEVSADITEKKDVKDLVHNRIEEDIQDDVNTTDTPSEQKKKPSLIARLFRKNKKY